MHNYVYLKILDAYKYQLRTCGKCYRNKLESIPFICTILSKKKRRLQEKKAPQANKGRMHRTNVEKSA